MVKILIARLLTLLHRDLYLPSNTHAYIPITMITNGEDTNRSFVDIVIQRSILAFKYACVPTHHYDNKW